MSGAHFSSEGLMRPDVPLMAPSVSRRMNCSHTFHINAGETKWNCLPHPSLWAINSGASFQPTWCPVSDTLAFCKQDGNPVISQYPKRWTRVDSIGINAHVCTYAGSHPISSCILCVCILAAEGCLFIWLQWRKVSGAGPGWGAALASRSLSTSDVALSNKLPKWPRLQSVCGCTGKHPVVTVFSSSRCITCTS